ncbi:MAG TPA: hypothetical protein PKC21_08340 [Oligoflexia bacterium]|nr:hypothetical protein [Oligoflexia bacterium]HMR25348.1 hypothetical protein [Oligoflexia bacterium]
MNHEESLNQAINLRGEFWNKVGELEQDFLTPIINPSFQGGPQWPSFRQSWRIIKREKTTILASDGLSDPYEDMDTNPKVSAFNGFGLEFFIESPDEFDSIKSWQFDLIFQASQWAAMEGNLINKIKHFEYISSELHDVKVPEQFKNSEGRVGVFVGLQGEVPRSLKLPNETISIVNVKLLTRKELDFLASGDNDARLKLLELFIKQGHPTYSSLERESVI